MPNLTKFFEGYTPKVFQERGGRKAVPTVGSGINVAEPHNVKLLPKDVVSGKRAITEQENQVAFMANRAIAEEDARNFVGKGYDSLDEDAREVVVDMHFNMGAPRMKKFKGFRKAIKSGDFDRAAEELRYSNADTKKKETPYYKQTKRRAKAHYDTLKNIKNKLLEAEMLRQLGGE